jgi:hypothetical protein
MATIASTLPVGNERLDLLSGTPRAHPIDRWIFVFMAAWFIAITLIGFIPDSIMKIGMVGSGARPHFPPILHLHAVLMGSFLLLLLAQTSLMALGRRELHIRLGLLGIALAAALVTAGFVLVPTMYYETWYGLQSASPDARPGLRSLLSIKENILLLQMRVGLLFSLLLLVGLRARRGDAGVHKRMMIIATAMALPAAIDRMTWLPTTFPVNPLSTDLYTLPALSPMLAWDLARNHRVHKAYWIWLAAFVPLSLVVHALWDTPWWHETARGLLRV